MASYNLLQGMEVRTNGSNLIDKIYPVSWVVLANKTAVQSEMLSLLRVSKYLLEI